MSLCVYGITLWNYSYRTLSNITKTATHPTTQLIRTDEHTTTGKFKQLVGKTEKQSIDDFQKSNTTHAPNINGKLHKQGDIGVYNIIFICNCIQIQN